MTRVQQNIATTISNLCMKSKATIEEITEAFDVCRYKDQYQKSLMKKNSKFGGLLSCLSYGEVP